MPEKVSFVPDQFAGSRPAEGDRDGFILSENVEAEVAAAIEAVRSRKR